VNWTGQYIEATGESFFNTEKFKIPGQAESMAEQGAKAVAMANLLEITGDVKVTKTTTVQNMITEDVTIKTEVEGIVRGAQVISTTKGPNSVVVKMRLPLYGDNGLAEIFRQGENSSEEEIDTPAITINNPNNNNGAANPNTNPDTILKYTVADMAKASKENGNATIPLLNLSQKDIIKNALSLIPPNIVNEKGELVVDMEEAFQNSGKGMKYLRYSKKLLEELKAAGVKTEKVDAIWMDGKLVIDETKLKKSGKVWGWVKNNGAKVMRLLPFVLGAF